MNSFFVIKVWVWLKNGDKNAVIKIVEKNVSPKFQKPRLNFRPFRWRLDIRGFTIYDAPARRRAFETKKFVKQDKSFE